MSFLSNVCSSDEHIFVVAVGIADTWTSTDRQTDRQLLFSVDNCKLDKDVFILAVLSMP